MKKTIAYILFLTFLFSNTTGANAKELIKKEYPIKFLVQVGQQYIDSFYESDNMITGSNYIVTDKNVPVYSVDKEIMAYILMITDRNGNETGYVMVGSNETSPVILEASLEENLVSYLETDGRNKKVLYLSPLTLAFLNSNSEKTDKMYTDVRTNKEFNYVFKENKNKITKIKFLEKNKENWKKAEELLSLQSSNFANAAAITTTATPTIYEIPNETNFVKIQDSINLKKYYYGGNQAWYKSPYSTNISCGPVAAANLMAYKAYLSPTGWGSLFTGNGPNTGIFSQSTFITHMNKLYDYLKPGALGIMSVDSFDKGVRAFMSARGVNSITSNKINTTSYSTFVSGITTGLSRSCPIALLFWEAENTSLNPNFSFHWITITKYYKDNNTNIEYFACSSWGTRYSLALYDYWWAYWVEGGVYYW